MRHMSRIFSFYTTPNTKQIKKRCPRHLLVTTYLRWYPEHHWLLSGDNSQSSMKSNIWYFWHFIISHLYIYRISCYDLFITGGGLAGMLRVPPLWLFCYLRPTYLLSRALINYGTQKLSISFSNKISIHWLWLFYQFLFHPVMFKLNPCYLGK